MARILWSAQSRKDLFNIRQFIARDSPRIAKLYIDKIRGAVTRLSRFPLLGEVLIESGNRRLRQVLCGNYRVIYNTDGKTVEIVTVIHAARLLDEGMLN